MQTHKPPRVDGALKALQEFLRLEAAGGLFLMLAAVLALVVANSPLAVHYSALLDLPLEIRIGTFGLAKPLLLWINDGLMAVFFFLVGMELKREMVSGHLSSLRQASLPAVAALGGMLGPAAFIRRSTGVTPSQWRGGRSRPRQTLPLRWAFSHFSEIVFQPR